MIITLHPSVTLSDIIHHTITTKRLRPNKAHGNRRCTKRATQALNPLTVGAVHIRLLHFLLAHYISTFKPVKDKKMTLISKI